MATTAKLNKDRDFLKRVLSAMQDIDTLKFESLENALQKLIKDLSEDFEHLVSIYDRPLPKRKQTATTSIVSLTDRRLEKEHKEFLDYLTKYITGVDRALNAKAVRYGNLCSQLQLRAANPKETNKVKDIFLKIADQEEKFKNSIRKINKLSAKKLQEAKEIKLTQLEKYQYQFKQLELFETLDWEKTLELLISRGKVEE